MALILSPSFDEHTRAEIEAHIAVVQARRMVAAVEYHHGERDKLAKETDRISQKISRQYDMLGKEILALDRLLEKVEDRLHTLQSLQNNKQLTQDMMAYHPEAEAANDAA